MFSVCERSVCCDKRYLRRLADSNSSGEGVRLLRAAALSTGDASITRVDVLDALQLQVGVTVVGAGRVDTVLIGDDLPELGASNFQKLTDISNFKI